jgi:hypothetical protein
VIRIILAVCALGAFVSTPAMADLLVHFNMDEASGSTIANSGSTGATNNATLDTANTFAPGILGTALTFDGTAASAFAAGATPVTGGSPRTVSAWIQTSAQTGLQSVLSFGPNTSTTKFDIDIDHANGGHVELGVGGGRTNFTGQPSVTDGAWHMVTVVLPNVASPTLQNVQFYRDGVFAYDGTSATSTTAINTGAGGSLVVGRFANNEGQLFNGRIDEIAIWNDALTADELAAYHGGVLSSAQLDASEFNLLRTLHSSASGATVVGGIRWDYAAGLSGPAGIMGSGPSYTMVLNAAAGTGVTTSGIVISSPADVNLDGVVNQTDLQVIATNFKGTGVRTDGDLNGDGSIEWQDYFIWRDNAPPALQGLSLFIPEPSSFFLAATALAVVHVRRRVR